MKTVTARAADRTLHAGESAKAGLCRVADGLIQEALERISQPSGDPAEDVHFIRTTTKRLRAILRLFRPVISPRLFERENARLKRIARRLAPARESSVARQTLDKLSQRAAKPRRNALAEVSKHLEQLAPTPSNTTRDNAMRGAARDLERARCSFQRLRITSDDWHTLGPGLHRIYQQARSRMKAAFADESDAAFHRWRTRVKALYYQLQTLESVWPKRLGKTVASLRKLEHKLGADHDLSVLKSILKNAPGKLGDDHARERVNACAHKESRRLRRVSRSLGEAIFADKSRSFIRKFRKHWNTRQNGSCSASPKNALRFPVKPSELARTHHSL